MKSTFLILLLLGSASLVAADDKASDKQAPPPPAKTREAGVPVDAVEIGPHTYRYRDSKGKVWIYSQTPFGVARREDVPASPEEAKKAQEAKDRLIGATRAVEEGDSIHFTRDSPFGLMEWRRKKADLNEMEQTVWNRELTKRNTTDSASKD